MKLFITINIKCVKFVKKIVIKLSVGKYEFFTDSHCVNAKQLLVQSYGDGWNYL